MAEDIHSAFRGAAELLTAFPASTRIRVVSHYDADGIAAAGVLCSALYRAGYDFHATLMRNPFTKGFDRLKTESNEVIVFADMGSGQLETIEQLGAQAIILDHHQYLTAKTSKNVHQINCNLHGIDGDYEASGATLSYGLATALDLANEDLAPLALAGATGDKQFIGGIRGFNKGILDHAVEKGFLVQDTGMKLYGSSLADALYFSLDPYYPGISGNKDRVEETLKKLSIDPSLPLDAIDKESMMRLSSFLLFSLIKAGCQYNILDISIRKRYRATSQGWELERFADLLDACGKNGHRSLGLSLCLGNTDAWTQAMTVEQEYKQKIMTALQALEQGGIHETETMRYFYSESSSLGGVIAGIAINYLLDDKKPLFSLARKEADSEVHVSCRGNQMLVEHGLDLAVVMKTVTEKIGGYGGGHKIAAGATIAFDKEKEFLETVEALLTQQMKG
jgi:RecJ-like exonuclease